jgi:hypothetical protein
VLLASEPNDDKVIELAVILPKLAVTAHDRAQARQALLVRLRRRGPAARSHRFAAELERLAPTTDEQMVIRETLLGLLSRERDVWQAGALTEVVLRLNPTVSDLDAYEWVIPPSPALMAAARKSSSLSSWLASLPLLSRSHTANENPKPPR